MSIGYACQTIGVPFTEMRRCLLKNATETKLSELISYNLNSLENMIDYNMQNNIRLFRISSDLIPFGSSLVNQIPWWNNFETKLYLIGNKIKQSSMRVSMHPGQYTVLNSPNEEVVARAIEDLRYHSKVLNSLGVGNEHKIILHIGGVYQNKEQAVYRFMKNFDMLEDSIKNRLVLENDDKSYHIGEVFNICSELKLPAVFDNLHHKLNQCNQYQNEIDWIEACRVTWNEKDGIQKIHYSQQNPDKSPGSHSESIELTQFMDFYNRLKRKDIDIMLEVKDKNLSALKCIKAVQVQEFN
jgi:UV DNA damage endonuclease